MLFSERYGFEPVRQALQVESMDQVLRNGLWNSYSIFLVPELQYQENEQINLNLWLEFFKKRIDDRQYGNIDNYIEHWFFDISWYKIYDFLEFFIDEEFDGEAPIDEFINECNRILEREMSAYRFVDGKIAPITSEVEIAAIEEATQQTEDGWSPVTQHFRTSLAMLSDRQQPNYRNSVKESISAVESACKIITDNPKATLGDALKALERSGQLHTALKDGFSKLYGYTSDEGGIRHALTETSNPPNFEEAKFMLVTCSAFVNYLRAKSA